MSEERTAPKRERKPKRPPRRPSGSRQASKAPRHSRDFQGSQPRRALSHQGGHTERTGEPQLAELLAQALLAPVHDKGADIASQVTHGFHSYPARMHPAIARHLLTALAVDSGQVLDPFCGSGTVLIEAMLAGHKAFGVDLNPLARRIAEVQCKPWPDHARAQLSAIVSQVAQASEARVRSRVKVRAPLPASEVARYAPHVLLELAGLHAEIEAVADRDTRRVLEVVFSSMVVKFSKQRSDTSEALEERRLRKGLVTEFFVRKSEELLHRWARMEEAMPEHAKTVHVLEGDARKLHKVLRKGTVIDLVISSPPYGGTYDYVEHHARRYPWLNLSIAQFEQREIGARRRLQGEDAISRWDTELGDSLRSMARVCRAGAQIILLLGDAQLSGQRVDAAAHVAALAPRCGLIMQASAAQMRPDFQGGPPRREHLIGLRVADMAAIPRQT